MAGSPLSSPRDIRFRWYRQVEDYGKKVDETCEIFGISKKTYYKWYRRDHGLCPGEYKNRKIHPHAKLTPNIKVFIVNEKEKYNYGPRKMKIRLKEKFNVVVSTTTIYKFYKKKRLIRKPQKKQSWYAPMEEPYQATKPGENVQLDVKYVPGTQRTWNYQFRFVDTVTNMQFARDMYLKDAHSTIQVFLSAERFFPFPIQGIQTDNGSEFRGVFHEYLVGRNVTHRYIPKRSAPWNGKVERANRSVDDEYYLNYYRPWKTLHAYTKWYNTERPHLGKGMNGLTPYMKLLSLTS